MNAPTQPRRLALWLGVAGGLAGVAAGVTQATVGDRIPEWSGAKEAPVALGLLTIALSVAAGLAAARQRRAGLSVRARTACAVGLIGPGLLCLSTVGRLWFLPAVLLVTGGVVTVDSWHETKAMLTADWMRVLLSALGVCELLMVAGAAPLTTVLGGLGGAALVTAAWFGRQPRWAIWVLVGAGTVPFAALAWTSIVPLLVTIEAFAVAATIRVQVMSS